MQLIITIDTEEDDQWRSQRPATVENIRWVPPFQEVCNRFGFPPTYLCTHAVVSSPDFDAVLLPYERAGVAEIGAHLHAWATPPIDARWDGTKRATSYASEIPPSLFRKKLEVLTDVLAERRGTRPKSFRAGRWGFSAAHIEALLDLGYVADCSVTPLVSWADAGAKERGQDFREAPVRPYYVAWGDAGREGASGLVEVPVTILQTNDLMRRSPLLSTWYGRHRKTAPARGFNRFFRVAPQWFRPFQDMTVDRLLQVYRTARTLDLPVIQMTFHSSELMPGGSPHNPMQADVANLLAKLAAVFQHLAGDGVTGVTLTSYAEAFRARHPR